MFNIIFQYSTIHITRYNSNKKRNKLIFVDDVIADMLTNKKNQSIVSELLIRGRKLNIYLVFTKQFCFAISKRFR